MKLEYNQGDIIEIEEEAYKRGYEQALKDRPKSVWIDGTKLFNRIAGHSKYYGDSILAAIRCMQEGKESSKSIKPIEDVEEKPKGEWLRLSNLSERLDDRYKCSHCGNVVHYKNKMDLYTFNSWCGRCGSNNEKVRWKNE